MFSRPTFWLGFAYERLVNRFAWLARLRCQIWGVVRKPAGAAR